MSYSKLLSAKISTIFEQDVFNRGKRLQEHNTVTSLQVGESISACVTDPLEGNCNTYILINGQSEQISVDGECSCEREFNCAHVAATLLHYIKTESATQMVQSGSRSDVLSSQPVAYDNQPDKLPEKQLHYLLSLNSNRLELKLLVSSKEQVSTFVMPHSLVHPARFIQSSDIPLLEWIQQQTRLADGSGFALTYGCEKVIDILLQSQRCHWQDVSSPVLQPGQKIKGSWFWFQRINGEQQLRIQPEDKAKTVLPILPLMYLDEDNQCIGLIDSSLTGEQDKSLLYLPAVLPEDISTVLQQPDLQKTLANIPQPQIATEFLLKRIKPEVNVSLSLLQKKMTSAKYSTTEIKDFQLLARLRFQYPGRAIYCNEQLDYIGEFQQQSFTRWRRDRQQEALLIAQWQELGWVIFDGAGQLHENWRLMDDLTGLAMARFIAFSLPKLVRQGWNIDAKEVLPKTLAAVDYRISCDFSGHKNPRKFR